MLPIKIQLQSRPVRVILFYMEIRITEREDGQLLRSYLRALGFSGTLIKQLKYAENGLLLNGQRVTVRAVLHRGDLLSLAVEEEHGCHAPLTARELPCTLLYDDGKIALLSKPSGMPTHPSRRHPDDTLANAAAFLFRGDGPFVFRVTTRLDADVSGAVLIARQKLYAARLCTAIASGQIEKTYLAVCDGVPDGTEGSVTGYVRRTADSIMTRELVPEGNGHCSRTDWRLLAAANGRSLIEVRPRTGKTHQIRLAMRSLGCPISGDGFYGNADSAPRCMLHAARLCFAHPADGRPMALSAPLYGDMKHLIETCFGEEYHV